ncbi:hypothetical protein [Dendronalium sp. ChiSLP03b]|uniref:hypothetical protein n=1 Tax=Dendronalium sp. ChiSLP03b TaxID=3075381 RepID=UPI002AD4B9A0|nr:hypothetical protein [Dendronalium sp. ChiSLP03b]MDZ8204178.1 hypothetical protein [Dendronalium sp. ChiSLP03b]
MVKDGWLILTFSVKFNAFAEVSVYDAAIKAIADYCKITWVLKVNSLQVRSLFKRSRYYTLTPFIPSHPFFRLGEDRL